MCLVEVESRSKAVHIEHWVQTKEWWNTELEGIVSNNLGDHVWPISERANLAVGSSEALLL